MNNDNQDNLEETLLHLRPKTAEEKLLWAESTIIKLNEEKSILQQRLGMLQSDLDELKHDMKTNEKDALILKNKNLKIQLIDKDNRIKDLKSTNEQLLDKVIRLQTNK